MSDFDTSKESGDVVEKINRIVSIASEMTQVEILSAFAFVLGQCFIPSDYDKMMDALGQMTLEAMRLESKRGAQA